MNPALLANIGHFVHGVAASRLATQISMGSLSAGAGLVVTTTGDVIDLNGLPRKYRSCKVIVPVRYGLASGHSWTIGGVFKHSSASGSGFNALLTPSSVAVTKVGATSTVAFGSRLVHQYSVDLQGAKRFIRLNITKAGNVTASGASPGSLVEVGAAVIVFGGADKTPASSS
jgi:hypothetical protein